MLNVLYEDLPECVIVDGKRYPIITDFREMIKLSELIEDDDVPDMKKVLLAMKWYEREVPEDLESAMYALGEFLAARNLYQNNEENDDQNNESFTNNPAFSFQEDAGCIYSAFRECYGIDLQATGYMHWWKFRTLFDWLPEDTEIKQRMYYRTLNLNSIKDKDERKRVKQIQERIRLKRKGPRYVSDYDIGDAFV